MYLPKFISYSKKVLIVLIPVRRSSCWRGRSRGCSFLGWKAGGWWRRIEASHSLSPLPRPTMCKGWRPPAGETGRGHRWRLNPEDFFEIILTLNTLSTLLERYFKIIFIWNTFLFEDNIGHMKTGSQVQTFLLSMTIKSLWALTI